MHSQSSISQWSKSTLYAAMATLLVSTSALADDTEVFAAQIAASQKPNLLFVLDYSGSMSRPPASGGRESKIDILRAAVRQVLIANEGKINAGIGSLYARLPSGPQWPISDLEADANTIDPDIPAGTKTVTDIISTQLDSRRAIASTATVDALAEAAAYLRGDPVYSTGHDPLDAEFHKPHTWDEAEQRYNGGSNIAPIPASYIPRDAYQPTGGTDSYGHCIDFSLGGTVAGTNYCAGKVTYDCKFKVGREFSDVYSATYRSDREVCKYERADVWHGANYQSPITQECQVNAIILVSDGDPTVRNNDEQIEKLVGTPISECEDLSDIFDSGTSPANNANAANAGRCGPELVAALANTPQVPSIFDSTIRTFTVGFDVGGDGGEYLEKLGQAGKGGFFEATSPESLTSSLNEILNELTSTSQSFTPLAIDVDRANFSHENRAFFSMFKPAASPTWGGNLKGYFIDETGLIDVNNNPATALNDDGIRVMDTGSQSFWSLSPDGDTVTDGGVMDKLLSGPRNLLTYTGPDVIPNGGKALGRTRQSALHASNNRVTNAMLGSKGNRKAILDWVQTAPMGDPLHSQPLKVNYDNGFSNQNVMYVMTNQGFLHAFDASEPRNPNGSTAGGQEIFAFMPKELLKNLPAQYANSPFSDKIYGLDGDLIPWHVDNNSDGIVNGRDSVLLVFGMRRGGNHYYALDVTNPDRPRLKWRLDGGSSDLPRLGETWSRPSLVNVLNRGVEEKVLAFGGGYDAAALDGSTARIPNTLGNAIYMVDNDGDVVMSIDSRDVAGMDYAIPSDLTIIDVDGDDVVDRIYVGDLGGNLWRLDFDDISSGASGKKLADLSSGEHRSFFYPPSVAINTSVLGDFLSVSIGSGNRTNPLRLNSNDRMFMIRDKAIRDDLPNNFNTITTTNLYDATDNDIGSSDKLIANNAREALNNSEGWYIDLGANEKSLSQLVTFQNKILATTFDLDADVAIDPCSGIGSNSFYYMDVATGMPLQFGTGSASVDTTSPGARKTLVNGDGILPHPTLVFTESGDVTVLVDNEVVTAFPQLLTRVYWHSR